MIRRRARAGGRAWLSLVVPGGRESRARRRAAFAKGAAAPRAGVGRSGCSHSSNPAPKRTSARCAQTAPSVAKRPCPPALLLIVRCRHLACGRRDARFHRIPATGSTGWDDRTLHDASELGERRSPPPSSGTRGHDRRRCPLSPFRRRHRPALPHRSWKRRASPGRSPCRPYAVLDALIAAMARFLLRDGDVGNHQRTGSGGGDRQAFGTPDPTKLDPLAYSVVAANRVDRAAA
jgi:hypothetical protein